MWVPSTKERPVGASVCNEYFMCASPDGEKTHRKDSRKCFISKRNPLFENLRHWSPEGEKLINQVFFLNQTPEGRLSRVGAQMNRCVGSIHLAPKARRSPSCPRRNWFTATSDVPSWLCIFLPRTCPTNGGGQRPVTKIDMLVLPQDSNPEGVRFLLRMFPFSTNIKRHRSP